MKKYEVIVEDDDAASLTALLQTIPYVKEIKHQGPLIHIPSHQKMPLQRIGCYRKTTNCKSYLENEI